MPNFSTSEQSLINAQKKPQDQLPQYFNATTKTSTPISRDFESYLILESQSHKQQTLMWIQNVQSITQNNTDRDTILTTYLNNRLADANATMAEVNTALNGFDDFQKGLFNVGDSNNFAGVFELGLLSQDLVHPVDEVNFLYSRAFQEKVICNIQLNTLNTSGFTADDQKELASWQTVVSTYPGQSGDATGNQQNAGAQSRDSATGILDTGSS